MLASNEVTVTVQVEEARLRVFFRRFLMVHLAQGFDMDDYLEFTPLKAFALHKGYS